MLTIWLPYDYHMVMARQQVLVQLNDELLRGLADRSARTGQARSEIIREAIERLLHDDVEAATDARLVAGYAAVPPDTTDEWGTFAPGAWLVNDDRWGPLETSDPAGPRA